MVVDLLAASAAQPRVSNARAGWRGTSSSKRALARESEADGDGSESMGPGAFGSFCGVPQPGSAGELASPSVEHELAARRLVSYRHEQVFFQGVARNGHAKPHTGCLALNNLLQAEAVLPSEVNELVARRRHDATEWAESDTLVRFTSLGDASSQSLLSASMSGDNTAGAIDVEMAEQLLAKRCAGRSLVLTPLSATQLRAGEDDMGVSVEQRDGFLCFAHTHWLALRRLHGVWLVLDPLDCEGPASMSDFDVSAFLAHLSLIGYAVCVVLGSLPRDVQTAGALTAVEETTRAGLQASPTHRIVDMAHITRRFHPSLTQPKPQSGNAATSETLFGRYLQTQYGRSAGNSGQ